MKFFFLFTSICLLSAFLGSCRQKPSVLWSDEFIQRRSWGSQCDQDRLARLRAGDVAGLVEFIEYIYDFEAAVGARNEESMIVFISIEAPKDLDLQNIRLTIGGDRTDPNWEISTQNATSVVYGASLLTNPDQVVKKGVVIDAFGTNSTLSSPETLSAVESAVAEVDSGVHPRFVYVDSCPTFNSASPFIGVSP